MCLWRARSASLRATTWDLIVLKIIGICKYSWTVEHRPHRINKNQRKRSKTFSKIHRPKTNLWPGFWKARPAELWVSLLGEVGENVAVDVEAAEEWEKEMQEEAGDEKNQLQIKNFSWKWRTKSAANENFQVEMWALDHSHLQKETFHLPRFLSLFEWWWRMKGHLGEYCISGEFLDQEDTYLRKSSFKWICLL